MPESDTAVTGQVEIALYNAVRHFRASTGTDVDPAAMAEALRTGELSDAIYVAVASHLREADPAELADLVIEGSASISGLRTLAGRLLPTDHHNRIWVEGFR